MVSPAAGRDSGKHTFRVFRPAAASVVLVGDFTDWQRGGIPLRADGQGWWTATAEVPPGEHCFCYLVDGTNWLPDYAAHGIIRSRFGGWVSRLCVEVESGAAGTKIAA